MNRASTRLTVAALVFGATFVAQAVAQSSGGQYRIDPVALPGGGAPIAGGNYQIASTIGLPSSGVLAGAGYTIFGGFWSPVRGFAGDLVFASGFELN